MSVIGNLTTPNPHPCLDKLMTNYVKQSHIYTVKHYCWLNLYLAIYLSTNLYLAALNITEGLKNVQKDWNAKSATNKMVSIKIRYNNIQLYNKKLYVHNHY